MNERPDEQSLGSGLGPDEAELRRLLHQAVDELEPRDETLEYLRRAVPARRARKRQALVGVAAAALFAGTAVPAALHVSTAGSVSDVHAGEVVGSTEVQGGQGDDLRAGGGGAGGYGKELPGLPGVTEDVGAPTADAGGKDTTTDTAAPAAAPACTAAQLSVSAAETGPVGADGSAAGLFRVYNASIAGCSVSEPGFMSVTAQGAADPADIGVIRHSADRPVSGLPLPAQEVDRLLLGPGESFEIRFSWVPSGSCPTNVPGDTPPTGGGSDTGSPSGSVDGGPTAPATTGGDTSKGTNGTGTGAETGVEGGVVPQLGTAPADPSGSVVVTFRPEGADGAGAPATVTVPGACQGTVYRTGIVAGG